MNNSAFEKSIISTLQKLMTSILIFLVSFQFFSLKVGFLQILHYSLYALKTMTDLSTFVIKRESCGLSWLLFVR